MRILIVTGIWPPDIGGPATHAALMRSELTERGHLVDIVTLGEPGVPRHEPGIVRYPRRWPWPLRMAAVVARLVRSRWRYDVVYAIGLHPEATAGARLARRPVVVRVVADPVWERSSRMGLTARTFTSFQESEGGGFRVRAMRRARRYSLRRATAVIVPTPALADHAKSWGAPPDRITVVPTSVAAPTGATRKESDGRLRVVFCGRLIPLKRVDSLIDAIALVPGAELAIVGDGEERNALERKVRDLGLHDRVEFHGAVPHEEALSRIAGADVLAMPSSYDTSPHVVVEALVCGTPVVGSAEGGLPELIENGENGILVDPFTVEGLAEVLVKLHADPSMRERLESGARASVASRGIDRAGDLIESVLLRSVGPPRAVFLGRTPLRLPTAAEPDKRLDVLSRHLDATVIAMGPAGVHRNGGVRSILFPQMRFRSLAALLYYCSTPFLALAIATRRGAVVCQSPHTAFGPILLSRVVPRRWRPRFLIELHGDPRGSARLYGGRARHLLAPVSDAAARWALRRADRVRTVGSTTTAIAREAGYEGDIDTFVTFSDLDPFVDAAPADDPARNHVVYAGALEATKGVDVLLSAWAIVTAEHPDAVLQLAGDGSLRDELGKRAAGAGLNGSVRFLGHVNTPDLVALLDDSGALVLPSRSEGTPRIVIEAMARGRAVVATGVGAIPDLVDNGRSGIIVAPDDPGELAAALGRLVGNTELSERMGREGLRRFKERDPVGEFEAGIARTALWIGRREE